MVDKQVLFELISNLRKFSNEFDEESTLLVQEVCKDMSVSDAVAISINNKAVRLRGDISSFYVEVCGLFGERIKG